MQDMDRIRYVTRSFPFLQGLRTVPFGLLMLGVATQDLGLPWLGRQGDCSITLPLLLVTLALYVGIGRYYNRVFGKVKPLKAPFEGLWTTLIFVTAFFIALWLEFQWLPPVSLSGIVLAAAVILMGVYTHRPAYTLGGLLIGIASFLPMILGVSLKDPLIGSFGFVFKTVLGLVWIVGGLLDHRLLVRTLQPGTNRLSIGESDD